LSKSVFSELSENIEFCPVVFIILAGWYQLLEVSSFDFSTTAKLGRISVSSRMKKPNYCNLQEARSNDNDWEILGVVFFIV
jgi:hypothetical protein